MSITDAIGRLTYSETLEAAAEIFNNLTWEDQIRFVVDQMKDDEMLRGEVLAHFEGLDNDDN